jgi:glutamate N-acetyltransferase/amino-acid N-acetyltransferase
VIMAVGKNPEVRVEPEKVSVSFGSTEVFKAGEPTSFKSDLLRQYLLEESVVITIRLGLGDSIAEAYGCDLTKGYIDINTCYN